MKLKHGGKRKNSGRPVLGKVRLVAKVKPETRLKILRLASGERVIKGTFGQDVGVAQVALKTIGEVLDEHFFEK